MLRIYFPGLQIGPGMTGVGVYARDLLRALGDAGGGGHHWIVGAPYPELLSNLGDTPGFEIDPLALRRDDPWGRMWAMHTAVADAAQRHRADVVLSPNFITPARGRFARVVLVHDLTFHRFPGTTPRLKRHYYRILVRHCVRRAARVLVTTRTIGAELAAWEPRATGKIRRIGGGVSPAFLANGGPTTGADRLRRPPRKNFLFVGTLEPRKNLARVLAAHGRLCRQDPTFPALELVGGKGWRDDAIHRALGDHPDPARVLRRGYGTAEDLREAYDSALALVFPSLYEGFGLPLLEAMARGCPVLTSRGIATEEVAGDAALLVDPHDMGEIERGMARLASDATLREELAARGQQRVHRWDWAHSARAVLDALEGV